MRDGAGGPDGCFFVWGESLTAVRSIIFDMGNVLIDFSHERACMQLQQIIGVPWQKIKTALFDSGLEMEYEAGKVSTAQVCSELETRLGVKIDLPKMIHAACDIFTAKPEMEALVKTLKSDGWRLVLLSNVNEAHWNWIHDRYSFLPHFDEWVLSFRVGACKPEDTIYEAAIAAAGFPAHQCLFIDDVRQNVEAARRLGIDAHQFSDLEGLKPWLEARGVTLNFRR